MRLLFSLLLFLPISCFAADFSGESLSILWGVPFAGILLSIALFPLFAGHFWEHHYGKVAVFWSVLFLVPFLFSFGLNTTLNIVSHTLIEEYIPFILLLGALFTVSGNICISGNFTASPKLNTGLLAIGTILASFMGTSGAAMLLIRPLLKANQDRRYKVHTVIFFIFLVANVGGGLTPLGDPPLFLGFLKGVTFGWTMKAMLMPVLGTSLILLSIFYLTDRHCFRKEDKTIPQEGKIQVTIQGKKNFLFLLTVVLAVIMSGVWKPGVQWHVLGANVLLENLIRDIILFAVIVLSYKTTSDEIRKLNDFNWHPILEVGKLFLCIFVTIFPVIAMLKVGQEGHFGPLIKLMHYDNGQPINIMYFWITGALSGVLDNAPTYLVFFNLAGGDANTLMGPLHHTLLAVSMGSVFMGAMTYIGNAPNFMVKSIAEQQKIKMPSFFSYMTYSCIILLPTYAFVSWLFMNVF